MKTKLFKSVALLAGFVALTACPGKNNNNNNNTNVPQGRISSLGNTGQNATCDINNGSFTCSAIDQMGRSCLSRAVTYNVNDNSNFCAQVQQLRQEQAMGSAMQCNVIAALDQVLNQRCGIPIDPNAGNGGNGGNNGGLGGNPFDPNSGGNGQIGSNEIKGFVCEYESQRGNSRVPRSTALVTIPQASLAKEVVLNNSKILGFINLSKLGKLSMIYKPASVGGTDTLRLIVDSGLKLAGRRVGAMAEGFAGGTVSLKVFDASGNGVYIACKGYQSQFKNSAVTGRNLLCTGGAKTAGSDQAIDEVVPSSALGQNREYPLTPDVTLKQVSGDLVSTTVLDKDYGLTVEASGSAQGPVKSESYTGDMMENAKISCFQR